MAWPPLSVLGGSADWVGGGSVTSGVVVVTTVAEGESEAVSGSLEGTLFPSEGDEEVASTFICALGSCARDAMTVGACSAVLGDAATFGSGVGVNADGTPAAGREGSLGGAGCGTDETGCNCEVDDCAFTKLTGLEGVEGACKKNMGLPR